MKRVTIIIEDLATKQEVKGVLKMDPLDRNAYGIMYENELLNYMYKELDKKFIKLLKEVKGE